MVRHAGAGASAEVQAEVEALRFHRRAKERLGVLGEFEKIELFAIGQLAERGDFPVRHGHEMPDGVGVAVHDEERALAARDDEMGGVVGGVRGGEEEVGRGRGGEVFGTPGSPEGGEFGGVHAVGVWKGGGS